jgi:hypothetical protein
MQVEMLHLLFCIPSKFHMGSGLLGPISALAALVEQVKMEEIKPGKKSLYIFKPALMTISEQQPPVSNGPLDSSMTSLNPTFMRALFQTATFFRCHG